MFDDLILQNSLKYDISSEWLKAIITQESNFNIYAIRYEPNYKWIYHAGPFSNKLKISIDTEIEAQKFSWGLGQLMGALARELGFDSWLTELIEPEINIEYVSMRLKHLKGISSTEDEVFAMYNGGTGSRNKINGRFPNQSYVDSVKKHLLELR